MAELLKLIKKAFHQMPLFVLVEVAIPRFCGIRFGRDAVARAPALDITADFNCAIGFIAHNNAAAKLDIGHNINRDRTVVNVTLREIQFYWITQSINNCVNLRVTAASRKTYILVGVGTFRPFLAPAAC